MIKDKDNINGEMVIQGKIECSFCKSDKYYNIVETPKEIPLLICQYLKNILENEKHQSAPIFCKNHPDVNASDFCLGHNEMICKECILKDHSDHLYFCQPI
jgi:hypothetical protein